MTNDKNENIELDGAEVFSDWSQLMGENAPSKKEGESFDFSLDNLQTDNGDAHWLEIFQTTNLPDMDLVALNLVRTYIHDFKTEHTKFKENSRAFLLSLPNTHLNELRVAGLSHNQIENMAKGILPINWTIHLKYPLAYGGTITENNFVLIPHYPFHETLHLFINQQMLTDAGVISPATLYMPVPKSAVYVPFGTNEITDHVVHPEKGVTP